MVGNGPVGTVAFEVELAPKSKARLDAILHLHEEWLLAGPAKRLAYVCGDERGERRIAEAAGRATPLIVESHILQFALLVQIKAHAIKLAQAGGGTLAARSSEQRA